MPKDVKVRLLDAPSFLDKPYTYSVPEHLDAEVQPGVFVTVPFGGGNRRHVALVTAREDRDPTIGAVKPIHALSTSHAALTPDMLALADFLCEQTLCTMGEAVHAMLPAGVLGGLCARYRVTDRPVGDVRRLSTDEAFLYAHLAQNGVEIYLKKIGLTLPTGTRVHLHDADGFFALGEVREFEDGQAIKPIKQLR